MSQPSVPKPVHLVISILLGEDELLGSVGEDLQRHFGEMGFISESIPFRHTEYYSEEMGPGLKRILIAFRNLISRDELPEIKLITNDLEIQYSKELGKRRFNVDPGALTLHNFILATGKDAAHRIYLGSGIYADLTLIYRSGTFRPLPWTYPDYASKPMLDIFNRLRKAYLYHLKRFRDG